MQADNREAAGATCALIERLDGERWELTSVLFAYTEGGTDESLFAFRKLC